VHLPSRGKYSYATASGCSAEESMRRVQICKRARSEKELAGVAAAAAAGNVSMAASTR
jgi:hypothetical protein